MTVPDGTARLLLGAPIATDIRAGVEADVAGFRERHGRAPCLAVVIVGIAAAVIVITSECASYAADGGA